jgi:hypothetical protein
MIVCDRHSLTPPNNGLAPVDASALFSRYYFWYSFSLYGRSGA